ncbi:MAG: hypothetical protein PHX25_00835 [Candidatus Pacebacteria bacterium]|nr:hypothetical protein [Candidatus Paceibacterota bacterium]
MNVQFEEDKYVSRTSHETTPRSIVGKTMVFLVEKGIVSDIEKAKKIIFGVSLMVLVLSFFFLFSSIKSDYDSVEIGDPDYVPAE